MKPKSDPLPLKEQFAQAKIFIDRKQYDHARALLRTIDHPTAQEWLAKLDKIAPEKPKRPGARRRATSVIVSLLLVCGALYALSNAQQKYNQTVSSAIDGARQEVAGAAGSVTPSATITETSTPTQSPPTLPPQPTSAPPETWFTVSTANLRSCSRTDCDQIVQLSAGALVRIIGYAQGEMYKGSDIWRIVDYGGQRVYVHSSLVSVNPPQSTAAPVQIIYPTSAPVNQSQVNPGLQCPKNCDTAVAQGWSAEQAGQCSNLNRDPEEDNLACYGE